MDTIPDQQRLKDEIIFLRRKIWEMADRQRSNRAWSVAWKKAAKKWRYFADAIENDYAASVAIIEAVSRRIESGREHNINSWRWELSGMRRKRDKWREKAKTAEQLAVNEQTLREAVEDHMDRLVKAGDAMANLLGVWGGSDVERRVSLAAWQQAKAGE